MGTGSDRRTNIPIVESSDGNTRNINDNNKNNNGYNNNVHHNHDIDHDYDHDDNDGDNNTRNYNNNNNNHTNNRTNNDAKKSHSNRSSNKQSQSLHGTAEADIIGIELEHPVLSIHNSNTTNITNAEAMLAVKRLQREKPCPSCLRAINAWAYEGERLIHGTPSGVDNSCSVFGGAILYRKGRQGGARRETKKKNKKKGAATMGDHGSGHERNDRGDTCDSNDDNGETKNNGTRDYSSENDNTDEDGSSFALVIGEEGPPRAGRGENKLIPYTLPNSIRLIITDTQQPRNTKRLVASVHRLYDQLPSVIGPIFESMDGLVLALLGKVCEAPGGGDDPSGYSSMKRNDEAGSDHDNNMLNINPININDNNCNDDGCENNDRGNARGGRKYETDGNRVDKSKPNTNTMSRSGKDADEREKNSIEQGKGNKTETDKAREKENEKDYIFADIGSLFTLNQHLLNSLGVGHSRIDEVVGVATSHGLHSKLTGAGGGGCVISLVPPLFSDAQYALFEQSVNAMNMRCFQTVIGQQGTLVYPQVASIEHVR